MSGRYPNIPTDVSVVGRMRNNQVALYLYTITETGEIRILMLRKCRVGERHSAGHLDRRGNLVASNIGPAGTNLRYAGKWCSVGGSIDRNAMNNIHGCLIEFRDETGMKNDISRHIEFNGVFHSQQGVPIFWGYLQWVHAKKLNTRSGTQRYIIFSSHGEIAENSWVGINDVTSLDLCDYVRSSFRTFRQRTGF